jgi:hypothetical protein
VKRLTLAKGAIPMIPMNSVSHNIKRMGREAAKAIKPKIANTRSFLLEIFESSLNITRMWFIRVSRMTYHILNIVKTISNHFIQSNAIPLAT